MALTIDTARNPTMVATPTTSTGSATAVSRLIRYSSSSPYITEASARWTSRVPVSSPTRIIWVTIGGKEPGARSGREKPLPAAHRPADPRSAARDEAFAGVAAPHRGEAEDGAPATRQ